MIKIRNVEIEFDLLDANDMEKFETECQKVLEESNKKNTQELSMSETIRRECEIVETFFDNVFGSGISKKIFKGKMNLNEHIKAFSDIIEEKIKAQNDLNNTLSKYLPNRNERRKSYKK